MQRMPVCHISFFADGSCDLAQPMDGNASNLEECETTAVSPGGCGSTRVTLAYETARAGENTSRLGVHPNFLSRGLLENTANTPISNSHWKLCSTRDLRPSPSRSSGGARDRILRDVRTISEIPT